MVLIEAIMLGEISLRAFVAEVKARRPDTARPIRIIKLILVICAESMRESDCG